MGCWQTPSAAGEIGVVLPGEEVSARFYRRRAQKKKQVHSIKGLRGRNEPSIRDEGKHRVGRRRP